MKARQIMRTMTFSAVAVATMLSAPVLMFGSPVLADPIHDAAKAGDVEKIERLIAEGVDVNHTDLADKTPLHWAADAGHTEIVQVLIAKGANIDARDFTNVTPLQLGILGEHAAIVGLLVANGADVNATDADGVSVLDDATRKGNPAIIKILDDADAKCGTNHAYSRICIERAN